MKEELVWALHHARQHTLALVLDLSQQQMCLQSAPGEHHPAWVLGHLLLADTYLLSLLGAQDLTSAFSTLLRRYGPGAAPTPSLEGYDSKLALVEGLVHTGSLRLGTVRRMTVEDLARPTPDAILAETQPTIGHHLQALVFHEGYHSGQLSSWRRARGFPAVRWTFAVPSSGPA